LFLEWPHAWFGFGQSGLVKRLFFGEAQITNEFLYEQLFGGSALKQDGTSLSALQLGGRVLLIRVSWIRAERCLSERLTKSVAVLAVCSRCG